MGVSLSRVPHRKFSDTPTVTLGNTLAIFFTSSLRAPPNCSSSKSKAYQTPCFRSRTETTPDSGSPGTNRNSKTAAASSIQRPISTFSAIFVRGRGRLQISVWFELDDGFSRHSSNPKVSFLGVQSTRRGSQTACTPASQSTEESLDYVARGSARPGFLLMASCVANTTALQQLLRLPTSTLRCSRDAGPSAKARRKFGPRHFGLGQ